VTIPPRDRRALAKFCVELGEQRRAMQYDCSAMEDRHHSDPAGPDDAHRPRLDRLDSRARATSSTGVVVRTGPAGPAGLDDGGLGNVGGVERLDDTLVQAIDDVLRAEDPVVWGRSPGGGGTTGPSGASPTPADVAGPTDLGGVAGLAGVDRPPATGRRGATGPAGDALGGLPRPLATMRAYVPRGNTLDDATFRRRHRLLCWVLAAHLPGLLGFGLVQGLAPGGALAPLLVPAACLVVARAVRSRRLAAFHVTAGLVFCSSTLVQLSGGMIEAHFHFFVLIGLIALYQDWVPFVWNVAFTVLSHGVYSALAADAMFNHHAGQSHPWTWALIHGVAVLAACVGVIVFWKNTELEQRRNTVLAEDLAAARVDAAQQQSVSELFVNLARRNQALLDRQLALITELEHRERRPEALEDLFQLDHLATRIRRNAESLLVLSGDEQIRRWGQPVALTEVVRAAAAEIEDYRRVEVHVTEHLELAGQAVADTAHLLAELIENATCFSPPRSQVQVRSHAAPNPGARCLLTVEDTGFGMSDHDIERANVVLADPPDVDLRDRTLGFQVVGRLARRYGLRVRLTPTPGGGVTAVVTLPDALVSERSAAPARPLHASRSKAATDRSTERERKRAMLSRFQASQRAGKAVAGAPVGSLAPGSGMGRHVTEEGA
jgi:signal transduction histidine kinase